MRGFPDALTRLYGCSGGKISNTIDSHRLLEWALTKGGTEGQNALVEQLFKFYFERRGDLGDHAALAREAAAVGLPEAEAASVLQSSQVGRPRLCVGSL